MNLARVDSGFSMTHLARHGFIALITQYAGESTGFLINVAAESDIGRFDKRIKLNAFSRFCNKSIGFKFRYKRVKIFSSGHAEFTLQR